MERALIARLRQAIGALSQEEQEAWLLRLAEGERNLDAAFRRQLMYPARQAFLRRLDKAGLP